MTRLFDIVRRFVSRLRPNIRPEMESKESSFARSFKRAEPHSRNDAMLDWCIAFNRRNGYRVPAKSARSIYITAHRRVKK